MIHALSGISSSKLLDWLRYNVVNCWRVLYNLSFISKLAARVVTSFSCYILKIINSFPPACQPIVSFILQRSQRLCPFHWQRPYHCTVMLDLSAAFDTVDQYINTCHLYTPSRQIHSARSPLPTSYQHYSCLSWFSTCWPFPLEYPPSSYLLIFASWNYIMLFVMLLSSIAC